MAIVINWDTEEKHAIRIEITGRWTWDEMWNALSSIHDLLEEVDYVVSIIVPNCDALVHTVPSGVLTQIGALNRRRHPRSGIMLLVDEKDTNANRLWYRMIGTVYPHFYELFRFINSMDTARQTAREEYEKQIRLRNNTV